MKKVLKYELRVNDENIISLPKGSEMLSAKLQNRSIVVYVSADSQEKETSVFSFLVLMTGQEFEDSKDEPLRYLDTLMLMNDSLVYHVFYKMLCTTGTSS